MVLIDTAGRMQDNEPLMRALAKLVAVNNPDKIIFVGEALVGNEAVDQLTKFNQSLKDFSGLQNPRHIDGMILTKFDTIDDKVHGEKNKRRGGAKNLRRPQMKTNNIFSSMVENQRKKKGWCGIINDIYHRAAYIFCGNWTNIYRS